MSRTIAYEGSVSAKSSVIHSSVQRLYRSTSSGGEYQNSLPRQTRGPAWNGINPGPIPASFESSQRAGLKEAASAPYKLVPMHVVHGVSDACTARYEDGQLAVGAAAAGEDGSFGGDADVDWELGV